MGKIFKIKITIAMNRKFEITHLNYQKTIISQVAWSIEINLKMSNTKHFWKIKYCEYATIEISLKERLNTARASD